TPDKFEKLSPFEKTIHQKAFVTNRSDLFYHELTSIKYKDGHKEREVKIPKGDVLYQFRKDVECGQLPAVSWLVAPENFSDHPASAWYGAWYISEVMDILTKNPEVWKKTIFILTYDENDGYFDHVPPFVAPHTGKPETGNASGGMDTRVEWVTVQQEKERNGFPFPFDGESPVGLGFRVPLIVASPWSRGGFVNSEVFDHTSTLQFLEKFLTHKKGKSIRASNISEWRRALSGDLTSTFSPSSTVPADRLKFLEKKAFMESVYNAKFKDLPHDYRALTPAEILLFRKDPYASSFMPKQEAGIKPSRGLTYQLYAKGQFKPEKKAFEIRFICSNRIFGKKSLGSPFNVYAPGKYLQMDNGAPVFKELRAWAFAVSPSAYTAASWPLSDFENGIYH